MSRVAFKPWTVPNFVRSNDEASIPFRLGALSDAELESQILVFVDGDAIVWAHSITAWTGTLEDDAQALLEALEAVA